MSAFVMACLDNLDIHTCQHFLNQPVFDYMHYKLENAVVCVSKASRTHHTDVNATADLTRSKARRYQQLGKDLLAGKGRTCLGSAVTRGSKQLYALMLSISS